MKRIISGVVVLGLGLIPIGPSAPSVSAQTTPERTEFSFTAGGYATNVTGGTAPRDSGTTALATLGCTNQAPLKSANRIAEASFDPLPVQVTNLRTNAQSQRVRRGFASVSTSTSDVLIGESPATGLQIAGLRTSAKAAFVRGEPQATVDFDAASVTFLGEEIPLESLQEGVDVPGVGEIEFGFERTRGRSTFARSRGRALRIVFTSTGEGPTVVTVGEVSARIDKRPFGGIFSGGANLGTTTALDGAVLSGPVINQPHKCAGTGGVWLSQEASGDSGSLDRGQVSSGKARVRTEDHDGFSISKSQTSVDKSRFGGIRVNDLAVKVNVRRTADGTLTSDYTTTIGRIRVAGEDIEIPSPGETVTVDGVAEFSSERVRRRTNGIDVTGLRIKLLDGEGAFIVLGRAVARIH